MTLKGKRSRSDRVKPWRHLCIYTSQLLSVSQRQHKKVSAVSMQLNPFNVTREPDSSSFTDSVCVGYKTMPTHTLLTEHTCDVMSPILLYLMIFVFSFVILLPVGTNRGATALWQ